MGSISRIESKRTRTVAGVGENWRTKDTTPHKSETGGKPRPRKSRKREESGKLDWERSQGELPSMDAWVPGKGVGEME